MSFDRELMKGRLHLFEVKLERSFNVHFETMPQTSMEDLVIQYIHVYAPPMDPLEY